MIMSKKFSFTINHYEASDKDLERITDKINQFISEENIKKNDIKDINYSSKVYDRNPVHPSSGVTVILFYWKD